MYIRELGISPKFVKMQKMCKNTEMLFLIQKEDR